MLSLNLSQGLSVVVPYFNEGSNVEICVEKLRDSLQNIGIPWEIIVVNDGSTEDVYTDKESRVLVLNLEHKGKISTRWNGLLQCRYESVMFIDSRVWIHKHSIENLIALVKQNPNSLLWNGFVTSRNGESPLVSFWSTLVRIGWGNNQELKETVSFGSENFDRNPKGLSMFVAARTDWLAAFRQLMCDLERTSSFPSDDTRLLREMIKEKRIYISPKFSADYVPRTQLSTFLKHAYIRGKVFVDSYWNGNSLVTKINRFAAPTYMITLSALCFIYGFVTLVIATAFMVGILSLSLMVYSFFAWRDIKRALIEGFLAVPFSLCFGCGYLKTYLIDFPKHMRSLSASR